MPVGGGTARAGLEIDHSEPKARVWRSRGQAAAHRRIEQPQKARRVLAPHGSLVGCAARSSLGWRLRCRWSWSPDRREVRGLQGLAGLRGDTPSEARSVDGERAGRPRAARRSGGMRCAQVWRGVPSEARGVDGERAGRPRAARRSGGVRCAEAWRAAAHRRIEQPQKARRVLASHGCLAGLAPHGDLAGCAIMLPRLAIARARTPVLSPAACTTLEGSS